MTACSDRNLALRFESIPYSNRTLLSAASAAEIFGRRIRARKTFRCQHSHTMITRATCRRCFLAGDPSCHRGNTDCAIGQFLTQSHHAEGAA